MVSNAQFGVNFRLTEPKGDSTSGQRVFYQFGMTSIPVYNVNNNCSTGSTGLHLARQMVSGGMADCVMVVGFEKMSPGSLKSTWTDRENPTGMFGKMMVETRGVTTGPGAAQMFGNAGREYMEKYVNNERILQNGSLNIAIDMAQKPKTSLRLPV